MDPNIVKETQDEQTLYDALASGNDEEVSRLMAAEQESEDTTEVVSDDTEASDEAKTDSTDEVDDEAEGDKPDAEAEGQKPEAKTEAAPAAASTDPAELQKELHRLRSDAGRVPYMQRRLQELERQLRAANTARSDKTADTPTPSAELPEHLKKKFDAIREVDPDLADAFEETVKTALSAAQVNSRAEVESYARLQDDREDAQFIQQQLGLLGQLVPNYQAAFNSPEWSQWKETLTPGRRALAESSYAEEVAQALRAFQYDMNAARQGGSAPQSQTVPAPAVATEENKEVQNARKKKMQTSADVKTGAAKAGQELDEEALYRQMYESIAKESHIL